MGLGHHAWCIRFWGLSPGPGAFWVSTPSTELPFQACSLDTWKVLRCIHLNPDLFQVQETFAAPTGSRSYESVSRIIRPSLGLAQGYCYDGWAG